MSCDVKTERHFYAEALTWAAAGYSERGSSKRTDCCFSSHTFFLFKLFFQMVSDSFNDDAREPKQCVMKSVHLKKQKTKKAEHFNKAVIKFIF